MVVVLICIGVMAPLFAAAIKYQMSFSDTKRRLLEQVTVLFVIGMIACLVTIRDETLEAWLRGEFSVLKLEQLAVFGSGVLLGAALWLWTLRIGFLAAAAVLLVWSVHMLVASIYSLATGTPISFIGFFNAIYNRDELKWVSGVIGLVLAVGMAISAGHAYRSYGRSRYDSTWNQRRKDWWNIS